MKAISQGLIKVCIPTSTVMSWMWKRRLEDEFMSGRKRISTSRGSWRKIRNVYFRTAVIKQ